MTIKVRLSGELDEITAMIQHLREAFDVAGGDRSYPNRGAFGARVYLEVRPRQYPGPHPVASERVHDTRPIQVRRPTRDEIEP